MEEAGTVNLRLRHWLIVYACHCRRACVQTGPDTAVRRDPQPADPGHVSGGRRPAARDLRLALQHLLGDAGPLRLAGSSRHACPEYGAGLSSFLWHLLAG